MATLHSTPASRRTFLKSAGASVFTAGAAAAILGAEDKAGARPAIVRSGDYAFECHHNWRKSPPGIHWQNTHGVAVDQDGLVYITHRSSDADPSDTVVVFDPEGKFVRSFGKAFAGGGHGIEIRREGDEEFLYLSQTWQGTVVKCDKRGEILWVKTLPTEPAIYDEQHPFIPTNVCFDQQGGLLIGDGYGAHYLHQYDQDGKWVRSFGGKGTAAGQFSTPHGQWLDDRPGREPRIVVADRANARLQYFTMDGIPVEILQGVPAEDRDRHGTKGIIERANGVGVPVTYLYGMSLPASIETRGDLMLIADLRARILIFNVDNELVANLGFSEEWATEVFRTLPGEDGLAMRLSPNQWPDGKFIHPHDACFDASGNIYVTEWVQAGRVTFLKRV